MISGVDNVIIAAGNISTSLRGFLDLLWVKWPYMRVSIDTAEKDSPGFLSWGDARADVLEPAAEILVCRDVVMEAGWERDGYALLEGGEGPFALMYEQLRMPSFRCEVKDDPYSRDDCHFVPYEVLVVAPGASIVTLVTPDTESMFSRTLMELLVSCIGKN